LNFRKQRAERIFSTNCVAYLSPSPDKMEILLNKTVVFSHKKERPTGSFIYIENTVLSKD
jgi:hypothetical protein